VADEGFLSRSALLLAVVPLVSLAVACGEANPEAQTAASVAPAPAPVAPAWPESDAAWTAFHSLRLRLTVPLPHASAWVVDDKSRPELVAVDASTDSRVVVSLETEPDLVNHAKCEARAIERKIVPAGMTAMRTIEDTITIGPEAFDTHVRVAIETGSHPEGPITGHVLAFGAYVKKCLFVHVETRVASAASENVLSDRLVLGRVRLLGGIRLDELGAVPREKPDLR
jgi:hypothetical protein